MTLVPRRLVDRMHSFGSSTSRRSIRSGSEPSTNQSRVDWYFDIKTGLGTAYPSMKQSYKFPRDSQTIRNIKSYLEDSCRDEMAPESKPDTLKDFDFIQHKTLQDADTAATRARSTCQLYPIPATEFNSEKPESSSSGEDEVDDNKEAVEPMPELASLFFDTTTGATVP